MDFKEFLNEQRRRGVKLPLKSPTEDLPVLPHEEEDPNKIGKRKAKAPTTAAAVAAAAMNSSTDIKLSLYDRLSKVLSEAIPGQKRLPAGENLPGPSLIRPRTSRPAQRQLPGGTSVAHPRGFAQGTRTPEYGVKPGPRDLGTVPHTPPKPPAKPPSRAAQLAKYYAQMQMLNLPGNVSRAAHMYAGSVELPFRYTNALRAGGTMDKWRHAIPPAARTTTNPNQPQRPTDWPDDDDDGGGGGQPGPYNPRQIGTRGSSALVRRRGASVVTRR